MNRKLLDILACPKDGTFPLDLHVFEEDGEIIAGILVCPECLSWYPIREKLPEMLPDDMRERMEELDFLSKWKDFSPKKVLTSGKPFNLNTKEVMSSTSATGGQ